MKWTAQPTESARGTPVSDVAFCPFDRAPLVLAQQDDGAAHQPGIALRCPKCQRPFHSATVPLGAALGWLATE